MQKTNVHIQWKQGSKFTGDAEPVYNELKRLSEQHGGITPAIVADSAKSKRSPLHRHIYHCDEAKAARLHYLERARLLTRSVVEIEVTVGEKPKPEIKAFSLVTKPASKSKPEQKVYEPTREALQDPIKRDEILAAAIREAIAFRKKYHGLQELAKVFAAMDELVLTAKV